jgi:hypothetical protein
MKSAFRRFLYVFAIGALILATATPTLAWSGPAPTLEPQTKVSMSFALRVLLAGPFLDVITILGVVVDDGVPF